MPGNSVPTEKVQGHWLLARLGKKILRPGGRELTERLLDGASITAQDNVVEFAPGLGATARALLAKGPASYTAIEADADAAASTRSVVEPLGGTAVVSPAQRSPLGDTSATVVIGEAMLTMQNDASRAAIIGEAARLLKPGGRFGIHELCLRPDTIDPELALEIRRDLSHTIHVGARPLTVREWRETLETHGFRVEAEYAAPMALLSPRRIIADEGLLNAARFFFRLARDRPAQRRVREMRQCFQRWSDHLGAVALVAHRLDSPQSQSEQTEELSGSA